MLSCTGFYYYVVERQDAVWNIDTRGAPVACEKWRRCCHWCLSARWSNVNKCTVLHRDTIVYRRGHRNLPARPSKMTGAAIETYRRGHRKWPARPSKPTSAAIENDWRGHRNRCVYRPSKMTGAAIETYRRGHRNLPARPSKMTGAAIKTYRRGHRNLPAGHFRWPRRSF